MSSQCVKYPIWLIQNNKVGHRINKWWTHINKMGHRINKWWSHFNKMGQAESTKWGALTVSGTWLATGGKISTNRLAQSAPYCIAELKAQSKIRSYLVWSLDPGGHPWTSCMRIKVICEGRNQTLTDLVVIKINVRSDQPPIGRLQNRLKFVSVSVIMGSVWHVMVNSGLVSVTVDNLKSLWQPTCASWHIYNSWYI